MRRSPPRSAGCFPAAHRSEAEAIADHACTRRSGRVGRSTAGQALQPEAVRAAVVASVRHVDTSLRHAAHGRRSPAPKPAVAASPPRCTACSTRGVPHRPPRRRRPVGHQLRNPYRGCTGVVDVVVGWCGLCWWHLWRDRRHDGSPARGLTVPRPARATGRRGSEVRVVGDDLCRLVRSSGSGPATRRWPAPARMPTWR